MESINNPSQNHSPFWQRLLNFDEFITIRLIKVIYLIGSALIILATVGGGGLTAIGSLLLALSNFSLGGILAALFLLILCVIGASLGVLLLRVYCELIMVVFKINENLQAIKDRN